MKIIKNLAILPIWAMAWSQPQLDVLHRTLNKAQPFNLEYTMSAIALTESDLGKYKINLNPDGSVDCGVFMVNTKTLTKNRWKQARICERLEKDYDFSFSIALERFKYFYNYWRSKGYSKAISWKRAICSYNKGFNWRAGLPYYKKVVNNIRKIRRFIEELD